MTKDTAGLDRNQLRTFITCKLSHYSNANYFQIVPFYFNYSENKVHSGIPFMVMDKCKNQLGLLCSSLKPLYHFYENIICMITVLSTNAHILNLNIHFEHQIMPTRLSH